MGRGLQLGRDAAEVLDRVVLDFLRMARSNGQTRSKLVKPNGGLARRKGPTCIAAFSTSSPRPRPPSPRAASSSAAPSAAAEAASTAARARALVRRDGRDVSS